MSAKSNFDGIVRSVISLFRDQGYSNCKVVGRGGACELTEEILNYLRKVQPYYSYEPTSTRALNKQGLVVDELHILISKKN